MSSVGGYAAVGIFMFLVFGFVVGVLLCVAYIKFVQWMRGKSLEFVPWPKVVKQRPDLDPVMSNPTYELGGVNVSIGNSITNLNFSKGSRSKPLDAHKAATRDLEVYEPIKEEELELEFRSAPDIRRALYSQVNKSKKGKNSIEEPKPSLSKDSCESSRKGDQELCRKVDRDSSKIKVDLEPSKIKVDQVPCTQNGAPVKPKPAVRSKPTVVVGKKSPVHNSTPEHPQAPPHTGGGAQVPNHVLRGVRVLVNH